MGEPLKPFDFMGGALGLSYEDLPPTPDNAAAERTAQSLGASMKDIEKALDFLKKFDPDDPWKGMTVKLESEVAPSHTVTSDDLKREDGKPQNPSTLDKALAYAKPTVTIAHPLLGSKVVAPAGRASKDGWKTTAGVAAGVGIGGIVLIGGVGFALGWFLGKK